MGHPHSSLILQTAFAGADVDAAIYVADLDARPAVAELAVEMTSHKLALDRKREVGSNSAVNGGDRHVSIGRGRQPEPGCSVH